MLRKDREITEMSDILAVIKECRVCHLAMIDHGSPYVVPLNFGYTYENNSLELYFHGSVRGRKIDALRENPSVFFEMTCGEEMISNELACRNGYKFKSVMGKGTVELVEEPLQKVLGLNVIMEHMAGKKFDIPEKATGGVIILKVKAQDITAKARTH